MIGKIFMIRILLTLLLLSSCGNLPIAYIQNFSSVNNVVFGYPDYEISQDIFDEYDNSFMKVRFGKGPHSILILAYIKDDVYEWVGTDDVRLFTSNGRVIKTIGLDHNFELPNPRKSNFSNQQRIEQLNFIGRLQRFLGTGSKDQETSYEVINLFNPDLYSATLSSAMSSSADSLIRFGDKVDAVRFEEVSQIESIGWKETNYYYMNFNSGLIDETTQHFHPRLPVVYIEFYYKF
ncbi:YjbF family lipoprotein [bacterium]|jgi:hypothetical protein|nr:YjbF family lipoprotein [bacterium]